MRWSKAQATTDSPDAVRDLIRDTASDLGLGLVRLQVDHRRIEDVFADADVEAAVELDRVGTDGAAHPDGGAR